MKIAELRAYPTSFPLPPDASVALGIGRAVKRDAASSSSAWTRRTWWARGSASRDHDPPARPLEDGRPDRGPPRRGARLRVEALDPPPHVDDRPQHGGHDPLPGRHRQRRLLRGGRLEGQPLPRPAHERALHAGHERLRRSAGEAGPRRRGGRGFSRQAPRHRGARVRVDTHPRTTAGMPTRPALPATTRAARDSAPVTAPIPSAAMRKPNPSAPSPSTFRATRGTTIVKLKTQRLTTSTRPRTSAIRDVPSA